MSDVNALAHDPEIKDLLQPNYLRTHQRIERQREIDDIERKLSDPSERKHLQNPGRLKMQNDQRKTTLQMQTPPPLTESQQNKLYRLNHLALESARTGMVPQEDMRHKPTGAADAHRRWEKAKKQHLLWWKATQILLNPSSDDRELCNFERYRPNRGGANGMMAEALIPPVFAQSPLAKQNWPLGEHGFTEQEMAEIKTKGFIEKDGFIIKKVRARPLRTPKDGGKVYEDKATGQIFSGRTAKARYTRHMKTKERRKHAMEQVQG